MPQASASTFLKLLSESARFFDRTPSRYERIACFTWEDSQLIRNGIPFSLHKKVTARKRCSPGLLDIHAKKMLSIARYLVFFIRQDPGQRCVPTIAARNAMRRPIENVDRAKARRICPIGTARHTREHRKTKKATLRSPFGFDGVGGGI